MKVDVRCEGGVPRYFRWRGEVYRVTRVLERWRDVGRWWDGEPPKLFFRIEARRPRVPCAGGLWEIYLDEAEGSWHLHRIYD